MIEIFLKNRKPIKTKSYKFFTFEAGFIAKRVSHFAMRPGLRVAYRDLTESLQRDIGTFAPIGDAIRIIALLRSCLSLSGILLVAWKRRRIADSLVPE